MARVKGGVHAKKKHKAVLKRAKGHYGNRSRTIKAAEIDVDRKMLADLAVRDADAFAALVKVALEAVPAEEQAS